MWRRVPAVVATILAGVTLAAVAFAQTEGSASAGATEEPYRLYVVVHTRNDRGKVYCAIWRGRRGYPTQRQHNAGETRDTELENHEAVCLFEDVTPGEYAAAVFHDENGNNDLDRNMFGIPSEGTGASNDAYSMFGPPGYDDARFIYPSTTRMFRIDVPIHY